MSVIDDLTAMGTALKAAGVVAGPGGNISARDGDVVICSPSGYDLDGIPEGAWSRIDLAAGKLVGGQKPTCEVELHLRAYGARDDVGFVCHSHPATVIGIISGGRDLEAFTPDFVTFVDHILHLDYVVIGSAEFATAVADAVAGGTHCIAVRNHGLITVGRTMREALTRTLVVEDQARIQLAALAAGTPRPLTPEQQDVVRNLDFEKLRQNLQAGE